MSLLTPHPQAVYDWLFYTKAKEPRLFLYLARTYGLQKINAFLKDFKTKWNKNTFEKMKYWQIKFLHNHKNYEWMRNR